MPNHVTTILRAPKVVIDFMAGEESEFDFNQIIPFPSELENLTAEVKVFPEQSQADAYQRTQEASFTRWTPEQRAFMGVDGKTHAISQETHDRFMREYGGTNWYNWNTSNWGTKWNAYDIERRDEETIKFETAWAFAEPIILALSEKFPDAELVIQYADEDWGRNYGEVSYKAGELIDGGHEHLGRGEDAEHFAVEVNYGMPYDQFRAENPDYFEDEEDED